MEADYFLAALEGFQQGRMHIPLTWDTNGLPKKPITHNWPSLKREVSVLQELPWEAAHGIGLVLGPVSDNAAVLDIDDVPLAERVLSDWKSGKTVKTIRGRAHIYLREQTPSLSTVIDGSYDGRIIRFELKAQGTQVACPPTAGYEIICEEAPWDTPSIGVYFQEFCERYEITRARGQSTGAGFPRPWQPKVHEGDRNKTAYIEAHKLREAGMPEQMAIAVMKTRYALDFDPGESWGSLEATVRSAYHKGTVIRQRAPLW